MTLLEYHKAGVIKDLARRGVVSINQITYFQYYVAWESKVNKGSSKDRAYDDAADECGCSKRTIQKAVKVILER